MSVSSVIEICKKKRLIYLQSWKVYDFLCVFNGTLLLRASFRILLPAFLTLQILFILLNRNRIHLFKTKNIYL